MLLLHCMLLKCRLFFQDRGALRTIQRAQICTSSKEHVALHPGDLQEDYGGDSARIGRPTPNRASHYLIAPLTSRGSSSPPPGGVCPSVQSRWCFHPEGYALQEITQRIVFWMQSISNFDIRAIRKFKPKKFCSTKENFERRVFYETFSFV